MSKKSSYLFSADVIRSLAILGVVVIHTVNGIYTRPDFFGGIIWWVSIILNSLFRMSIPLFILLSGYLILGKKESLRQSAKRILRRLFIPLVVALFFYAWWAHGQAGFESLNPSILRRFFYADVYHLYFLVIMIGLYAVAPLIRVFLPSLNQLSQIRFTKILLVLGMIEIAFQFIFQSCAGDNFFTRWVPYTGLFTAGYVFGHRVKEFSSRSLLITFFSMLILTVGFNYFHYFWAKQGVVLLSPPDCLSHYYDHYLSLNVVIMSFCAFLFILPHQFQKLQGNPITSQLIKSIAQVSLGIYLSHLFIGRLLEIKYFLAIDFTTLPIYIYLLLKLFLTFGFSYLISLIFSKIPFLKLLS